MITYNIYGSYFDPKEQVYSFPGVVEGSHVADVEVYIGCLTLHTIEPKERDSSRAQVVVEIVYAEGTLMHLDACDFVKICNVGKRSAAIFASVRAFPE